VVLGCATQVFEELSTKLLTVLLAGTTIIEARKFEPLKFVAAEASELAAAVVALTPWLKAITAP